MATDKNYLDFIHEQLSDLDGISSRPMMGEYILYYHKKIAAYLCDNRLLVRPVPSALRLMPDAPLEPPYAGAGNMLLVERVDDREFLKELFETIYDELPKSLSKRPKPTTII